MMAEVRISPLTLIVTCWKHIAGKACPLRPTWTVQVDMQAAITTCDQHLVELLEDPEQAKGETR